MDIVRTEYPFSNIRWGPFFDLQWKALDLMEQLKTKFLVAYSTRDKKAVGIVTLREINSNLWGIWDIYVSPDYRRRGISHLLYQASFSYLRQRAVRKAVGSVETINIASVKGIEKMWDKFLPQSFYEYQGTLSDVQTPKDKSLSIRGFHPSERDDLFRIYKQCAHREWYSFLEIEYDNFLERFIRYPCHKGLLSLFVSKQILVAQKNGTKVGYCVLSAWKRRLRGDKVQLYFFISPQLSIDEATSLIDMVFNFVFQRGLRKVYAYTINTNEKLLSGISNMLHSILKLRVSENLVPIKSFNGCALP